MKPLSSRAIDETGNTYGRLTALEYQGCNDHRHAMWKCQCACGNTAIVQGRDLRKGTTRSCGCLRSLPAGEAAFNQLYLNYHYRPRKLNLDKEQFRAIVISDCHYCGTAPQQRFGRPAHNGYFYYNGVDRVDSSKGYDVDNVVPCCGRCNVAKNNMPLNDFLGWLERAYKHNFNLRRAP